jgi:Inner membrane component of T3SS, cytoplasmic domain
MIQLNILSGKKAGSQTVVRLFPFHIGRAEANNLQLEDDGVWDQHLSLEFQRHQGFVVRTTANALAAVNGQPVQTVLLCNGDVIILGSARLQFWLGTVYQRGLRAREFSVWVLIAAVCIAQLALIYWLIS